MITELEILEDTREVKLRESLAYDIRQLDYEDLKKMKELATELSQKRSSHYFFDEEAFAISDF